VTLDGFCFVAVHTLIAKFPANHHLRHRSNKKCEIGCP
jgi:hypothetical protein